MSISGTAVALPGIGADTHAGQAPLQWVVNAFNVAFACFTLVWGSIAEIVGRARAFTAGAAVYAVASPASALAPGALLLDVARALAGIGGAAIFSCGSAILSTVYEGPRRAKAFALFGTVAGMGVAIGPSLSGALLQAVSWRWVFALHAVALAVVLLAVPVITRAVPATPCTAATIDITGSAVFVTAMVLLTTAIVQGSQRGWGSPGVLGLFAGALVVDAAFTLFGPDVAVAVVAMPMIVTGAGMALAAGLVDGQALELVDSAKAGMAAGFLNTLRLGSEAVAVALYGCVFTTLTASRSDDSAFHLMLWGLAAVCLALGLLISALLTRRTTTPTTP
ncbi:MFS transporter [Streptomyces goshikiensis]|uniref:MFS transporter n=1 Tax=Streptomyces goshikiensis TaxID=1942 RepID=UPI0037F7C6E2